MSTIKLEDIDMNTIHITEGMNIEEKRRRIQEIEVVMKKFMDEYKEIKEQNLSNKYIDDGYHMDIGNLGALKNDLEKEIISEQYL